jgi:hypothetical protein
MRRAGIVIALALGLACVRPGLVIEGPATPRETVREHGGGARGGTEEGKSATEGGRRSSEEVPSGSASTATDGRVTSDDLPNMPRRMYPDIENPVIDTGESGGE